MISRTEIKFQYPEIWNYFDGSERDKYVSDLFDLIYRAADGNRTRAINLFRLLWGVNIKCVADFDCARLLNLQMTKGIGAVYGHILVEMFKIRLEETLGSRDIAVPLEKVMEVDAARSAM